MEKNLQGRVALVTGGGRGIGRATALALAEGGAKIVMICGRNLVDLEKTSKVIAAACPDVFVPIYQLDATKAAPVNSLFQTVAEKIGTLDILVNNIGGVSGSKNFMDLTDDDWLESFQLNMMTAVRMTRGAVPLLLQSQHASIVNISSVAALQPVGYNAHYRAIKAALIAWAKGLSYEYGPNGIRVNSIAPSKLTGDVFDRDVRDDAAAHEVSVDETRDRWIRETLGKSALKRMGTPEDVAQMVVFLCSDAAGFITGSCLNVDGGTVRAPF